MQLIRTIHSVNSRLYVILLKGREKQIIIHNIIAFYFDLLISLMLINKLFCFFGSLVLILILLFCINIDLGYFYHNFITFKLKIILSYRFVLQRYFKSLYTYILLYIYFL